MLSAHCLVLVKTILTVSPFSIPCLNIYSRADPGSDTIWRPVTLSFSMVLFSPSRQMVGLVP